MGIVGFRHALQLAILEAFLVEILHQNFFISANAMVQKAGITALKYAGNDVIRMKQIYNERRKFMIRRLQEIGLGITVEPTGAFYVFANARHISLNSYQLAFDILEKARVGVAPGIDFGKNGEGYFPMPTLWKISPRA